MSKERIAARWLREIATHCRESGMLTALRHAAEHEVAMSCEENGRFIFFGKGWPVVTLKEKNLLTCKDMLRIPMQ